MTKSCCLVNTKKTKSQLHPKFWVFIYINVSEKKKYKAVLKSRVSPAFAITYFCDHCNIRFMKRHITPNDLWSHTCSYYMCKSTHQGSLCPGPIKRHHWPFKRSMPQMTPDDLWLHICCDFHIIIGQRNIRRCNTQSDSTHKMTTAGKRMTASTISNKSLLMVHNCQKWKSNRFFICPCHKIYWVESVCLSLSNYTFKLRWVCEIWGNFVKICYFVNNCLIKVQI